MAAAEATPAAPRDAPARPPSALAGVWRVVLAQAALIAAAALIPALLVDGALRTGGGTNPSWIVPLALIVGAVAAALHVAVARYAWKSARPLRAIEHGLTTYAAGIEHDLAALQLSTAFGAAAQGWNQLIRQVSELQEMARQQTGGGNALARFEFRQLRQTLDRVPFGVVRFGADDRIRYANAAAARMLETAIDAMTGRDVTEVIGEECARPLLGAHRRGAGPRTVDRVRGEAPTQRVFRLELVAPLAGDGDTDGLIVIQDVTHLQEAEQARDNLLYHVTHELRTPLTNIQAYAETLGRLDVDDERTRKECYNVIVSETSRLSQLIEDILNISQLEVGSLRVEWGDVDLLRLVRQVVQDHLGQADEKKQSLTLKVPPKCPSIRGDKHKLAVLFTNVVGNAIKYTPAAGRVDVRLEADPQTVRLSVRDTGIGIAPSDLAHVFDKFYRAECDEVRAIKGTGLGLAISREIATLHGGDIRVESTPGQGSTFTIELPVQTAAAV